jgi:hypothetical protein
VSLCANSPFKLLKESTDTDNEDGKNIMPNQTPLLFNSLKSVTKYGGHRNL